MADSSQHVVLPPYSMFMSTPIYSVEGETVFGLMRDPIVPDPTDQAYTVPAAAEDRLWLVADLFYQTSELWWVIALVNQILDPMQLPAGTQLRIPTKSRLASEGILD